MIRALTDDEKRFILGVAERLGTEARDKLLSDLAIAQVETAWADGEVIRFRLEGYEHPHGGGQALYQVEGEVSDEDGSLIALLLFSDPNDRLYELEYIRWEDGRMRRPNWATLRFLPDLRPSENGVA